MDELTFEQALAQLERAVQALEAGDLPLAEALAVFERGMQVAEWADQQLSAAELRVREIVPDGGGGRQAISFDNWQGEAAS